MDGYECSEILFSQLDRTNRLDAEFYKKDSLKIVDLLKSLSAKPLTNLVNVSDGNHMSISSKFVEVGVPYYRGQDIHHFFIEDSNPICIDENTYNVSYMQRSHLKKGDILLSIVGTIGEVSLVSKEDMATCNCKLAILRPYDTNKSALIAIYLKTKYGFDQVDKFKRGAVQMGYLLEDMNQIFMPEFTLDLYECVNRAISVVKLLTDKANNKYIDAEKVLLSKIGIEATSLVSGGVSVKSFSDSLGDSGRLDAEYYQPKYDSLIESISVLKHKELAELVKITKSIEPGSDAYFDEGIPFIRISDISKYEITEPDKYLEECGEYDNSELYLKKDEILFSKDGSVGIAYKVEEDSRMISSSALLHLEVKDKNEVLPDYLTTVLNSDVVQLQAERDAGGSIIKHWKPKEIEKVVIPILDIDIQKEIAKKASESFKLRKQSRQLLDCTKNAVEMAIEKGEKTAIKWLNEKNKELMK